MANRSDRDPPSLNGAWGLEPTGEMRRGSADSIRASGHRPRINRPDTKLQSACPSQRNRSLRSGRRPYKGTMLVGYARVSTLDQNPQLQLDALREAGCEKIYSEKASTRSQRRAGPRRGLDLPARRRHAGGLEARPPRPIPRPAHPDDRPAARRRYRLPFPNRAARHHHAAGPRPIPDQRRVRRVRAIHHPGTHPAPASKPPGPPARPSAAPPSWTPPS